MQPEFDTPLRTVEMNEPFIRCHELVQRDGHHHALVRHATDQMHRVLHFHPRQRLVGIPLTAAASALLLQARRDLGAGEVARALGRCSEVMALERDVILDRGLIGVALAHAIARLAVRPCAAATEQAPGASGQAFLEELVRIRAALPPYSQVIAMERTQMQLMLFGRFLSLLAQAGWLAKEDARWVVKRDLAGADPARVLAAMRASLLPIANELEMVGRAGPDLANALRGECDPLQLLFPGGETETAERIYRDSPPARFFNGLVAEAVSTAAARARQAGRKLRILEVGAGTGGTTAHVVPRLPLEGVEYTFTDVGPLFVARAVMA